ncbi:hypothetical protein [Paenibacillus taiwanensis]|nr:hypothetical protein [Paenibacillus taiwanensis]
MEAYTVNEIGEASVIERSQYTTASASAQTVTQEENAVIQDLLSQLKW